ncbi:uncharacterized protein LOC129567349 [Sitodiplosis mosellana]|uniref:uncharacterized protein LOC129567349 n=1 Tax=Sitodiplosis mosellana TaxID=263140 RepID=UPI002443E6AB|nr:uncharacterized protein LOC129567349 [Sitodiplosis mosellana]XP_055300121.1 uncharacterized protein LOC129567349 [Sitodiplosis mosellana]XP_055300122.1 uncharacterized protein LOC129567349 [Sitodiplosis mosellana]XP_055300124.1 uncharacterized protein LOC129567349 [Sitodiplosis mosellana]XP_055300125.1 uncharacterized protein LOC129567349 [Sitodiplosis mosellana]XP_055300126.1 uncharacterized protein LOC129567349 [Sitodiplosis mosellana]XP_055300127.1 uncharacterized protein LOC129567349 [
MALLQVRHSVGTLHTLRLVFLSAIIIICTEPLSANGFLSSGQGTKGPDPLIKLVVHPQEHVIIPIHSFAVLHCEANFTDYPEYDYEADEAYFPSEGDYMQNDEPNHDSHQQIIASSDGSATNLCQQEVQYQWLHNGRQIIDSNSSFTQIFCNGTIKIRHSTMATGTYRCVASTTKPEVGAVVSKASHVRAAVFQRKFDKLSSKAELGSSVILHCPIDSVPQANIQWTFNNESNISFDTSDRYFQLNNGSLLIVNVKNEDYQSFRCVARNAYSKEPKYIQHSLEVINSISTNNAMLLPALQNQAMFVPNGNALNLNCAPTSVATSKGNAIRWTFLPRSGTSSVNAVPTHNPNRLHIASTFVQQNDGIYKCHFGDEYQTFDVTITTPPVIHNEFSSKEEALGFYVALNCNATGNPKPEVQFYHNGKLIVGDWIVKYKEPKLLIQTYEEKHKGIYQCAATNVAGEAQATGLLSLKPKVYPDPPRNPKCFPLNSTSLKVVFDGPQHYKWSAITYYIASKYSEPQFFSNLLHDENRRVQNEFIISDSKRPPFEPLMLYFRGMEKTSSDTTRMKGGTISWQFDISRLSEGIKCATQGLPVYGMFSPSGIFVWWPKEQNNVTAYVIQFQSDETTAFSNHIVGTTRHIDEFQTWNDISSDLTNIPVVANIYPNTNADDGNGDEDDVDKTTKSASIERKKTNPKMITELRVNGNVSGILIPNTHEIVVRVLVPIIDDEGELIQDVRYVEWKKIEDVSGAVAKFTIRSVGINHVIFQSMDRKLACVRICYKTNGEKICDERSIQNSFVEVDSLTAATDYKFLLYQCGESKKLFFEGDIETEHDIPGSVSEHKVYKKNGGIALEWSAPTKPNGILDHYLIQWTIGNVTHSEEFRYQEREKNVFEFPGLQDTDRFNISICAVSNFGNGLPIYVDLRDVTDIPEEDEGMNAKNRDPRLGISIGVLLSVLCIIGCVLIIIRHRRCSKSPQHQHINGNGNNARGSFQNRSPLNRAPVTGTTMIVPNSSAQISANCAPDAHEMQTLIVTSSVENIPSTNGNGVAKKLDNHNMNGVVVRGNRNSFNNANVHSDDDDHADLMRCGLISSTPKLKHKTNNANNDHLKNTSTNHGSHTANPVDLPYRRIDCDLDALGAAEIAPNITLGNGTLHQMKTTLPPNKSVHSIVYNETEIPPTIKRTNDDKVNHHPKHRISTAHKSNVSIPSIFDDSQQSLLPDANATESSSASTSSGSVPMDRIANKTNCIFDVNTFDNGAPHPIIENQRYMRSAALV